jgi:hypothetical protein
LSVPFAPPAQPEETVEAERESGSEGSRTTRQRWLDGIRVVDLRCYEDWWGATTTTSGGASRYTLSLAGLPGAAAVAFPGLSHYEILARQVMSRRIETALLDDMGRRLESRAVRLSHPSLPSAWEERARRLKLAVVPTSLHPVAYGVLKATVDGRPLAVLVKGTLGERWGPHPDCTLLTLGPLPPGEELVCRDWPSELPPAPSGLLRLVGDGHATVTVRIRRPLRWGDAAGLLGGHSLGEDVEEVTAWRSGPWVLREARVYSRGRLEGAEVALQHEDAADWALFVRYAVPLPSGVARPGTVNVLAVGSAGGALDGIADRARELLSTPQPAGPPLPEFVQLSPAPRKG